MTIRYVLLFILIAVSACVPKPQDIKGCGSGLEFNDDTLGCVSANPAVVLDSTFNALAVVEDVPESFSLPTATTDAVGGSLYWFIVSAPVKGDITGCADRGADGKSTGVGTSLLSCIYTPDANYVGTDAFSYKVCNAVDGKSRCGATTNVVVTVTDDSDGAGTGDKPVIGSANSSAVFENASVSIDIRGNRSSISEDDDIYVCMQVFDPDGALAGASGTKTVAPSAALPLGTTCTLVGAEDDNLSVRLANFSATANLLPCAADDCSKTAYLLVRMCESASCPLGANVDGIDNDADGLIDEEDEWDSAALESVSAKYIPITVTARNFVPVISASNPVVIAGIAEASAAITIGTDGGSDRVLPTATDLDPDPVTYEYVPLSFFPTNSGVLSCVNGADLACTFTPDSEYAGSVTFRYLARDSKNAASNIMTVSLTVSSVNDAPIFLPATHLAGYAVTPVALTESTTLAARTFKVGEGGGAFENSQTLSLTAVSSNVTVLPTDNIVVRRGATVLGDLGAAVTLDSPVIDADAQTYTMDFTPVAGEVTDTPITITLTLDDGFTTTNYAFNFTGVTNVNNPPAVVAAPATSLAYQLGRGPKDLVFRATPGTNDWDDVVGGGQGLTVTVNSSAGAVVDASATNLTTAGGGISIVKSGACTATSCLYTLTYDGSNDPADDDLILSVPPGVRGTSTLSIVYSDGVVANNVTTLTTVNVYDFAATFNGWSNLVAKGKVYGKHNGFLEDSTVTFGWNGLAVTEGGSMTSAYTVRVYRSASKTLDLNLPAMSETGVAAAANAATFTGVLDDGTLVSGERFYAILVIVPDQLGEEVVPAATADDWIEVIIPPDNMALAHRWITNKNFCDKTLQAVDRAQNYRCANQGLGAIQDAGSFYYDQQHHLFVDIYENGCPYDTAFVEDTRLITAVGNTGRVHYERSTGACTYSDGASWLPYDAVVLTDTNTAEMPPLVQINRDDAAAVCQVQSIRCEGAACADLEAGKLRELPSRREMIGVNEWPTFSGGLNIDNVENSGNHSLYQSCNTDSGNGLGFVSLGSLTNYWQDTFPSAGFSGNRMLINSAVNTSNCASRFGIRNLVGNAGEWLADTFSCSDVGSPDVACSMGVPVGNIPASTRDDLPANNSTGVGFAFDGTQGRGPLYQNNPTMIDFSFYIDYMLDSMHVAVGLVGLYDGVSTVPKPGYPRIYSPAAAPDYVDGGFWSYDGQAVEYVSDTVDAATSYAFSQGGNWDDEFFAGRYAFRIRQVSDVNAKTGFRCVIRQTPVP